VSKERQKARAARDAARAAEVAAAARKRERTARRKALVPAVTLPKRRRRYGQLPLDQLIRLVVLFFAVQGVVWFFFGDVRARISLAVITLAVLLVHVSTRRSTTR
jgi:hypothetical protein